MDGIIADMESESDSASGEDFSRKEEEIKDAISFYENAMRALEQESAALTSSYSDTLKEEKIKKIRDTLRLR